MIIHGKCREEFNESFKKKIFLEILPDTYQKIKTRWGQRQPPIACGRVIVNVKPQDISHLYGKWCDYHCKIQRYNTGTFTNEKLILLKTVEPS